MTRTDSPIARGHYFARLAALRDDAVPAAAALLSDPNPQTRALGAAVLKFAKSERARDLLLAALHDSDEDVRHIAALGLAMHHDSRALGELLKLVTAGDPAGAGAAVVALGRIGGDEAVDLLIRAARSHPAIQVRGQAIDELSALGVRKAVPVLIECLSDEAALPGRPVFDRTMERVREVLQETQRASSAPSARLMPAPTWPKTVADLAARALRQLTGESFGFSSADPPERKRAAIQLWQQWWQQQLVG